MPPGVFHSGHGIGKCILFDKALETKSVLGVGFRIAPKWSKRCPMPENSIMKDKNKRYIHVVTMYSESQNRV